jgi:ADP-heptose:LPS heptosyltransferase
MLRQLFKSIVDTAIYFLCKGYSRAPRQSKTLLIFRKDGIGDYIIFYPYLKYLKKHFADYRISIVVSKVALGLSPLLKDFDVIEFDNKKFSASISYRYRFIRDLTKRNFEIAFYPVYSREPICDMVMKLTGGARKASFKINTPSDRLYTDLVALPEGMMLDIERNREFSRYFEPTTPEQLSFPTIDVSAFDSQKAEALLKEHGLIPKKFCVVFPGTGAEYKKWGNEKFAEVCDYLSEKNVTPVLCGASSDISTCGAIVVNSKNPQAIVDLSGQTNIGDLAHILKQALFYFGNDTGAVHLAAAVDTPTICIMGGGHFGRFFPYGNLERNRIIFDSAMTCKGDEWACAKGLLPGQSTPCIANIAAEQGIQEIDRLLSLLNATS